MALQFLTLRDITLPSLTCAPRRRRQLETLDVCGSHVSPSAYPHVRDVRQGGAPLSWPLPSY